VSAVIDRFGQDERERVARAVFGRLPADAQWAVLERVFDDAEIRRYLADEHQRRRARLGRSGARLAVAEESDRWLPSQMVAEVLRDVDRAGQHLASYAFETATLYANALASKDRYRHEIVVLAQSFTRPRASSQTAFDRGKLEGRVFLYDFATSKVVCAGTIAVTSSRQIGFTYSPAGDAPAAVGREGSLAHAIDEDMELQIAKAARIEPVLECCDRAVVLEWSAIPHAFQRRDFIIAATP
jgi:hypothetical protein